MKNSFPLWILSLWAALYVCGAEDFRFFEQEVRPLLVGHCYKCHSRGEKVKGGLLLDSKTGWEKGGDSGPALVPGNPGASLLMKAVLYGDKDLQMPPKEKLDEGKVEVFREWIAMGAPDPRKGEALGKRPGVAKVEDLWSLQPLVEAKSPEVGDPDWSGNAVDRFVYYRLAKEGLVPAKPAGPATLLRRLYLDLTGLPPTPEDIEAFDAGKVAAVVDKLLASEAFGDKWARHWLDLMAYADTLGVGRSIPALEAWRYRDYVVHAFNSDKPYNQFVRQQLSGDIKVPSAPGVPEGPDPTAEGIIATGFLAIGPWELVGGDKVQLRMDVVDRQINRVGKAFLGMTFECGRCHDHKFDPFTQEDYYALAGIFKSTVTLNGRIDGVFNNINQHQLPESPEELMARAGRAKAYLEEVAGLESQKREADKKVASLQKEIAATKKRQEELATEGGDPGLDKELKRLESELDAQKKVSGECSGKLGVLKYVRHSRTKSLAYGVMDTPEPMDANINIRGNAHQLGNLVPRGFPHAIAPKEPPEFTRGSSGRVQLAEWITDKSNPLAARVWVNRVWYHLFGSGLVRTVDNFGSTGELPSHPELLDHLAAEFVKEGWSTKKLIRKILLTRTWKQSSSNPEALSSMAQEKDPGNRLLWRANRRRMEAEALRDSMLFVAGKLDMSRGGPCLPYEIPGNLSPGSTGSFKDDTQFPPGLKYRRTLYLPQKRKGPFDELDFIRAFDLPDTNNETGQRTVTAVPTQALYLANSKFVREMAAALSARFSDLQEPARIDAIYRHALNHRPDCQEAAQARQFIEQIRQALEKEGKAPGEEEKTAWIRFCHSLLISNAFLFRS